MKTSHNIQHGVRGSYEWRKVDIKDYLNREGDSLVCALGPPRELLKSKKQQQQRGLKWNDCAHEYVLISLNNQAIFEMLNKVRLECWIFLLAPGFIERADTVWSH